jgi:hypothetical protein
LVVVTLGGLAVDAFQTLVVVTLGGLAVDAFQTVGGVTLGGLAVDAFQTLVVSNRATVPSAAGFELSSSEIHQPARSTVPLKVARATVAAAASGTHLPLPGSGIASGGGGGSGLLTAPLLRPPPSASALQWGLSTVAMLASLPEFGRDMFIESGNMVSP